LPYLGIRVTPLAGLGPATDATTQRNHRPTQARSKLMRGEEWYR
jgi:hypothetical protein